MDAPLSAVEAEVWVGQRLRRGRADIPNRVNAREGVIMRSLLLAVVAASIAASGCTHSQLRRSTVGQSGTVADIYQQQVLNNLAKFAHDPNSLPDFGVPTSGLAQVTDSAKVDNAFGWSNTALQSVGLSVGGSRGISQNWSLKPVQDPRKLELMRCAYRQAVGFANCSSCCPDCEKRFNAFYTGDPCKDVPLPCQECPKGECAKGPGHKECEKAHAELKADTGIVTSRCLGSCWFHVGCGDCLDRIKKQNPCCLIGEHCGTVVWVCPGRGTDELSKLTIAVLDYAVNDPAKKKTAPEVTRQIVGYFDGEGKPSSLHQAAYQITTNVAVSDSNEIFNPKKTADSLQEFLLGRPIDKDDLRPLPSADAGSSGGGSSSKSGPTRSDAQLELLQISPGFLPPQ